MHLELRCRLEYFILESGKRHSLRGSEYKLVQAETNGSHVVASVCFFFVFFVFYVNRKSETSTGILTLITVNVLTLNKRENMYI